MYITQEIDCHQTMWIISTSPSEYKTTLTQQNFNNSFKLRMGKMFNTLSNMYNNNNNFSKEYICQLVCVISYCGVSVNIEQLVIMSSSLSILYVPVRPPINRILFSLIWTDIPNRYPMRMFPTQSQVLVSGL